MNEQDALNTGVVTFPINFEPFSYPEEPDRVLKLGGKASIRRGVPSALSLFITTYELS
jgi:hypothetical protein